MEIIIYEFDGTKRTLWDVAKQEFFASLFLFLMLYPMGSALGDSNIGWAFHYLMLLVHAYIFGDACVNPSVSFALWTMGLMSAAESYVRGLCSMLAAVVAYPLLQIITPAGLSLDGPVLFVDVKTGAFVECWLGFFLMLCILIACSRSNSISAATSPQVTIAAGVRALIYLEGGKYTGCSMNPMIAFAYLLHRTDVIPDLIAPAALSNYSAELTEWAKMCVAIDWVSVYVVAPTVGCVWAGWVWNTVWNDMKVVEQRVDTMHQKEE